MWGHFQTFKSFITLSCRTVNSDQTMTSDTFQAILQQSLIPETMFLLIWIIHDLLSSEGTSTTNQIPFPSTLVSCQQSQVWENMLFFCYMATGLYQKY